MRLLIPTDFSKNSQKAFDFAYILAGQLKAELIVLHVLPDIGPTLGRQLTYSLIEEMQKTAEAELEAVLARLPDKSVPVSKQIVYGPLVQAINAVVETDNVELVVMSSKGASGIKKILFGSNAVDLINNCRVPVVIIPEDTALNKVRNIIYASDFTNMRQELTYILPFCVKLKAGLRILNLPPKQYLEYVNTDRLVNDLKQETSFQDISVTLLEGENTTEMLERFVEQSDSELLVMFTHHVSFAGQLFKKSITREIVWHNKVPLMVIPGAISPSHSKAGLK